jgi:D-glycero-D-manno-heptose 1,7-bisphosphate phosphatase
MKSLSIPPYSVSDSVGPHKPAVFIDRDGTINKEIPYTPITSWERFEFLPGVLEALRILRTHHIPVYIVTNQSIIGRRISTYNDVQKIHMQMLNAVMCSEGDIVDIAICPHTSLDYCSCRKPLPGLLYYLSYVYNIDLFTSIMIGNSASDIEAGENAGIRKNLIIRPYADLLYYAKLIVSGPLWRNESRLYPMT